MSATILCVEDEPDFRNLLVDVLSMEGFNTLSAANVPSALDQYGVAPPDLILADVNMPNLTGFDMMHHLQERYEDNHAPVIFLTAMGHKDHKIEGYSLGADDYITKPIDFDVLVARIKSKLAANQRQRDQQQKNYNQFTSVLMRLLEHASIAPLNTIYGFSELLTQQDLDENAQAMAEKISESAEGLTNIIRCVTDAGNMMSGQYEMDMMTHDWQSFMASMAVDMGFEGIENMPAHVKIDESLQPICLDGAMMQPVVQHMAQDALRHAGHKGSDVSIRILKDADQMVRIELDDDFRAGATANKMRKTLPCNPLHPSFLTMMSNLDPVRALTLLAASEAARVHGGALHIIVENGLLFADIRLPEDLLALQPIAAANEQASGEPEQSGAAA